MLLNYADQGEGAGEGDCGAQGWVWGLWWEDEGARGGGGAAGGAGKCEWGNRVQHTKKVNSYTKNITK